jgi:hypothetical protein
MRPVIGSEAWARGGAMTILICVLMHSYQGILLLAAPHAINATPLLALSTVFRALEIRDAHLLLGWLLIVSSALAGGGALARVGRLRIWLFLPQHFFLGVMATGGIWASFLGHYLDGTVIPWQHISADQAPIAALFLVHTVAIVLRCWEPA